MNLKRFLNRRRVILAAIPLFLSLVFLVRFAVFLARPAGRGETTRIVELAEGATLKRIAKELGQARIISRPELFTLYARIKGKGGMLKAGAYRFSDGMPPGEILGKLVAGDVYVRRFSVPEGYSIYQIAELLDQKGFYRKEAFLRECFNQKLLKHLGIDGKSVEGYLYPCTYDLTHPVSEEEIIERMTDQFKKIYVERFERRARDMGMKRRQMIILASMIEKEAVVPWERPLIASVFHNRLRRGMPLQSDPTAIYGVRAFGGKVSKKDILNDSPYNTYRIKGLPPGPIGNPSAEAMEAALNPAKTGYLYFVAKRDGTHAFSTTLDEHNRGVQRYLKSAPPAGNNYSHQELRNDRPHLAGRR